ncbi:MAG: hypothetical protein JW861_01000 [Bacteroidales bacterium]|nr:hypothetical protein [Bacteroidales bacterium]
MKTALLKGLLYGFLFLLYLIPARTQIFIDVKAYLEGPFDGSSMATSLNSQSFLPLAQPYNSAPWNYQGNESVPAIPSVDVVDWVLVELRETPGSASTAYEEDSIASSAGFLLKDGHIVSIDGISPLQFNCTVTEKLYVVLYHRNHLAVLSGDELVLSGGIYSYDFTSGSSQAYGGITAHKELVAGVWGMCSGDGNADGQVNNLDKNDVWTIQAGSSGYLAGDFSMNGQVDNTDKIDHWSVNSGRSQQVPGSWSCNQPFAVNHTVGDVAPVNKTVSYGTVGTDLTGINLCWITQNLGSDQQASSATGATEASAGWYWQFNKKQGYKHDGTTRTPNTPWITNINENSDWQTAHDPCAILLGSGWRLPAYTEWNNADQNGGWNNLDDAYNSVLKLHAAGYLYVSSGTLFNRGVYGDYWSSTQFSAPVGWALYFLSNSCNMNIHDKPYGFSARCLKD